jgi:hypothetical protein
MDEDHGSGDLVRRTGANDLGEQLGRLRPPKKPFFASMSGKVINQLMHNSATKGRFFTLDP